MVWRSFSGCVFPACYDRSTVGYLPVAEFDLAFYNPELFRAEAEAPSSIVNTPVDDVLEGHGVNCSWMASASSVKAKIISTGAFQYHQFLK